MSERKKGTIDETAVLYARVPARLIAELDAWVKRLNAAGLKANSLFQPLTRNELIRVVLTRVVRNHGDKDYL